MQELMMLQQKAQAGMVQGAGTRGGRFGNRTLNNVAGGGAYKVSPLLSLPIEIEIEPDLELELELDLSARVSTHPSIHLFSLSFLT